MKTRIKELDVYIEGEGAKEKDKWLANYSVTEKAQHQEEIEKLQVSKKNGLTSVLVIGFGDNDGDISGPGLGSVMDYDGRSININEKDFVVWTEQNR